ncbi:MAG TPA: glycosyltransferase family 4 protein [Candidatus Sulfotelmatobacter sp.]|nr:glycosyltransferase family 4 protein [Candidatus Sulfotelmatobacter sp.]
MTRRLAILTEIIAPYRIPVFNALAARSDVDLHVIFLSENDPSLRQWHVYKNEIRFSYEVLPAWRRRLGRYNLLLNWGVSSALRRARPDALLCGGYSYMAAWQSAFWAKRHRVPLLLWSESTALDLRRSHGIVEFIKRRFRMRCQAFVAAGRASRDYLIALGATDGTIFIAPDAVDVEFFAAAAAKARQQEREIRVRHNLPPRYFLCVGRLIKEKGVFELLEAYAKLEAPVRSRMGLVFVGDGTARDELAQRAAEIRPGVVRFCGWVHREQIPEIYALAEALVFPTYSDPWGLVVNEAMACRLPIIASQVAGCVPDLLQDGWNGFAVRPRDVDALEGAMQALLNNAESGTQMGSHSFLRVQGYTPETCAAGIAQALAFAAGELS